LAVNGNFSFIIKIKMIPTLSGSHSGKYEDDCFSHTLGYIWIRKLGVPIET
jgi:hypothetical protein